LLKDISLTLDSLLIFKVRLNSLSTAKEMGIGELPVISDLGHVVGRWNEILLVVLDRGLLHWLE
jgi:hypothetical protein